MTYQPGALADDMHIIPQLPAWITSSRAQTSEDVAFLSGAALSHLHFVVGYGAVPQTLLRARLALRAAEACVTHQGRPERAADLRDAAAFLQLGDNPGPAGETYLSWRRVVERSVSVKAVHRALPQVDPEHIDVWLVGSDPGGAGKGAPVVQAAAALEAVRADRPRDQTTALIMADASLARSLGWSHVVPLLAIGMKRGDLRKTGEELRLACHRAIVASGVEVTRHAADLSRRAARLNAAAPKLRAKGAEDALALFLSCDAVAPTSLTSLRSDRAARRFCDRLVELGAVCELTGRDTFRLYGV